jgi:hypothetical protein
MSPSLNAQLSDLKAHRGRVIVSWKGSIVSERGVIGSINIVERFSVYEISRFETGG